ncbi:hypothetical protein G7054_g6113 [Neopestalotiopsis clavispora]|nr:hypothetical protein G7054_g6113 [Neopestalotiopsis clavispora]
MSQNFRCIIVGGGPIGLVTAHALTAAGMEWVLLEQEDDIVVQDTPCVVMYPDTLRVMDQLGLSDRLSRIKTTIDRTQILSHEGATYNTTYTHDWSMENHGRGNWYFHQPQLVSALYEALSESDKARVKTSKEVTDIDAESETIVVHCSDGTAEEGSLVIGAEGCNSIVRDMMRINALAEDPKAAVNTTLPFAASYRVLWGTIPMAENMKGNEGWECHGKGYSSQMFFGRGRGWFFVYEKLKKPTRGLRNYTEKDMYSCAARLANLPMTNKMRLRDVYAVSHNCGMADLGEGLVRRFAWGRTVLIGEAGNKQTSHLGLGLNSGVQDVVALTNILRKLVQHHNERHELVETEAIHLALRKYDAIRRGDALHGSRTSARAARLQSWNGRALRLYDRYFLPSGGSSRKNYDGTISSIVSHGMLLDFVPESDPQYGRIPWVHA